MRCGPPCGGPPCSGPPRGDSPAAVLPVCLNGERVGSGSEGYYGRVASLANIRSGCLGATEPLVKHKLEAGGFSYAVQ